MSFYFFEPSYHKSNSLLINQPYHINTDEKASFSSTPCMNEYYMYPYYSQHHNNNFYNRNRSHDFPKDFIHDLREALKEEKQGSKNIKRRSSSHSIEIPITEVSHEPQTEIKQEPNVNTPDDKEQQRDQYANTLNTSSSIPIFIKETVSNESTTKDANDQSITLPSKNTKEQKYGNLEGLSKYPYFNHYEQTLIYSPKIDIIEDEKKYNVYVDLPGITKEQIQMEILEDNILKISGERKSREYKDTDKKSHYIIMERDYGHFERSFMIPFNANTESIQAKMENGVLEIIIDKKEVQKKQTRTIQIQ